MPRSKKAPKRQQPSLADKKVARRLSRALVGVKPHDTFVLTNVGWHVVARQLREIGRDTGRQYSTRQVGDDVEVMRIL